MAVQDPDWPLFQELLKGNSNEVLEKLIDQYGSLVAYWIRRILSTHMEEQQLHSFVDEGINTVFFVVWNDQSKYDPQRGTVKSWITGIARIVALSMRRQILRHSRMDVVDLEVISDFLISESDPAEEVLKTIALEEAGVVLEKAMAKLTPMQKQLVRYRFRDNLSYREMAEEVGMRPGAIRVAVHRALRSLKGFMEAARLEC